ncbi:4-alpha-glucanotransferase [Bdellovibrio sp. HCB185ZH]|uniref:4-alpha-glucanotransferase n=1 Tax=Bdellovibrio sp. HCB185ZH TaxID=3394235 RepID=UPI0039A54B83
MADAVEKRLLRKAARYWGIQPDYLNALGEPVASSSSAIRKVLSLLSGQEVKDSNSLHIVILERIKRKVQTIFEPASAQKAMAGIKVSAFLTHDKSPEKLKFLLEDENGNSEEIYFKAELSGKLYHVGEKIHRRVRFHSEKSLKEGYYHLSMIEEGVALAKTLLISAPAHQEKSENKKLGFFAPLYSLRSQRNWGIGDLGDLSFLQKTASNHGVEFIGTLPLLAQDFGAKWDAVSPYSPVSKMFWNEIYLDLDEIVRKYPKLEEVYQQRDLQQVAQVRESDKVLYSQVVPLKQKMIFDLAQKYAQIYAGKDKEYIKFLTNKFLLLEYCQFRSGNDREKMQYHLFSQFQMERQLKDLKKQASKEHVGIYLDYPVGTSKGGFDNHHFATDFINQLNVGAPPDLLFRKGQNWGIAPPHPEATRKKEYRYLIESLRAHMLSGNYIRLDHVMAFKRLYVIPEGHDAREGVYLRYQPDEVFAVVALEAKRHEVHIIGENLGTVPESIQRSLKNHGFKGMWVFPFEAGDSPSKAIAKIPSENLICLNTHDLYPFQGFLQGLDIEKFKNLGIYTAKKARKELHARQQTVAQWCQDLNVSDPDKLFVRISELMAESPGNLFLMNIEDLWGETLPQNIPGTWHEYPNWSRKLKFSVEEWCHSSEVNKFINRLAHLRKKRKEHGYATDLGRHLSLQ